MQHANTRIQVKLTETREEFEEAYTLLQAARCAAGFDQAQSGLWLTKHHALPSTIIIIAMHQNSVVGAIGLFGDSPLHLPLDEKTSLHALRDSLNGRIAELSLCGIKGSFEHKEAITYALFHYAVCFSSTFCHHELIVTNAPDKEQAFYKECLGFATLLSDHRGPGTILSLYTLKTADHKRSRHGNVEAEFQFPEKKFFLVNHHVMKKDLLDYFFNRRSRVFDELNDLELPAMRNIYSFGKYAEILPQRENAMIFPKLPKFKRFDMSCEGFFYLPNKRKVHFEVLDVSSSGLRLKLEEPVKVSAVYMLNISIGVMKDTEVIAKAIWAKRDSGQVGMEVRSADQNWKKLIQYLEEDFHRQAA